MQALSLVLSLPLPDAVSFHLPLSPFSLPLFPSPSLARALARRACAWRAASTLTLRYVYYISICMYPVLHLHTHISLGLEGGVNFGLEVCVLHVNIHVHCKTYVQTYYEPAGGLKGGVSFVLADSSLPMTARCVPSAQVSTCAEGKLEGVCTRMHNTVTVYIYHIHKCLYMYVGRASPRADQGKEVRGHGGDRKATSSHVDHCKQTSSVKSTRVSPVYSRYCTKTHAASGRHTLTHTQRHTHTCTRARARTHTHTHTQQTSTLPARYYDALQSQRG